MNRELFGLDKRLVDTLRPIVEQGVTLRFPFFANTFPLAFHLMLACGSDRLNADSSKVTIKLSAWGTPISELMKEETGPAVFYATKAAAKSHHDSGQLTAVPVCLYQPRALFLQQSPHALAVSEKYSGKLTGYNVLSELLDGRQHIDVFSDIVTQARAIIDKLCVNNQCTVHYADAINEVILGPPFSQSLRLYLYGGPLTAYLRRKRGRFLPFTLPAPLIKEASADFETCICVSPPNTDVALALQRYHEELFRAASKYSNDDFWNVCDAYNRVAHTHQHRSSFLSAAEYARCLHEHYSEPVGKTPSVGSLKLSNPDKALKGSLVLYGCGNLSLGLILPSLRSDLPVIVVIVMDRPDAIGKWSWVNEMDKVTLGGTSSPTDDASFTVVRPDQINAVLESGERRILTIVDTWAEAIPIIQHGDYIATCMGEGLSSFGNAAKGISLTTPKPLLLFENRIDKLNNYRAELERSFHLHHVLCDRICTNRTFVKEERKIIATSEKYGELVIASEFSGLFNTKLKRHQFTGKVSDLGPAVDLADLMGEPDGKAVLRLLDRNHNNYDDIVLLYRNRKRWLMNGIHHVLALLSANCCNELQMDYRELPVFLAEPLLDKVKPALRNAVDTYTQCQIGRMMIEPMGSDKSKALVDVVLEKHDKLSLFENLRLFTDVNRWRCGRGGDGPDMVCRLISLEYTGLEKLYQKFREHVDELMTTALEPQFLKKIKELGVPFSPSSTDIYLADKRLRESQGKLCKWLMEHDRPNPKPAFSQIIRD